MNKKTSKLKKPMAENRVLPAVKCRDKTTGKIVNAYHIDESGAAHNKSNTLCIGCIGADLFPVNGW